MEIKHIDKNKLEFLCIDIITQALADLGQKDNDAENKVMMAQSLAKDLMNRYSFMPIEAVYHSFENGIRDTDLFVLSPRVWCKWLNKMKKDIWEGWYNYEIGSYHTIQPHIRTIMQNQPELLLEYKNKKTKQIN